MTRILLLSDIHANLTALESVINAACEVDAVWCLGDVVGYGPDPNQCIELLASLPHLTCVLGNHDAAVIKRIEYSAFNVEARESLKWTADIITAANLAFLQSLPDTSVQSETLLAHGSPRNPLWEYILDPFTAVLNFFNFDEKACMVGHSHIPTAFFLNDQDKGVSFLPVHPGDAFTIKQRSILNPGSVGQPRDHDPRASYVLYNPEAGLWENFRINYDIPSVQKRIRLAGLPEKHALRLDLGA